MPIQGAVKVPQEVQHWHLGAAVFQLDGMAGWLVSGAGREVGVKDAVSYAGLALDRGAGDDSGMEENTPLLIQVLESNVVGIVIGAGLTLLSTGLAGRRARQERAEEREHQRRQRMEELQREAYFELLISCSRWLRAVEEKEGDRHRLAVDLESAPHPGPGHGVRQRRGRWRIGCGVTS